MLLRRCAILLIEPRERLEFDLASISPTSTGLVHLLEWVVLAPHLDEEIVLNTAEVVLLGQLSPQRWSERAEIERSNDVQILQRLIDRGLVLTEGVSEARAGDESLRNTHWRAIAAVQHRFNRWRDIDTLHEEMRFAKESDQKFLDLLGAPPPPVGSRVDAAKRVPLTPAAPTPLDELISRRVTCRNFDSTKHVSATDFASILWRVFGERGRELVSGVPLLKKSSPSAGGLHPTEAYLLVQNVENVAPGLYHYHVSDHALEPLRILPAAEVNAFAQRLIAGQRHFYDAHVFVVMASRFFRLFWKYRNHAKAYRASILDAGHLSQTMYLAATELGLGAFTTAAVNEVDIEQGLGLDPMQEGVLAVGGFGVRAAECKEMELDPNHKIWP